MLSIKLIVDNSWNSFHVFLKQNMNAWNSLRTTWYHDKLVNTVSGPLTVAKLSFYLRKIILERSQSYKSASPWEDLLRFVPCMIVWHPNSWFFPNRVITKSIVYNVHLKTTKVHACPCHVLTWSRVEKSYCSEIHWCQNDRMFDVVSDLLRKKNFWTKVKFNFWKLNFWRKILKRISENKIGKRPQLAKYL